MASVFQPFGLSPSFAVTGIDRHSRFDGTTYSGGTTTKFYDPGTAGSPVMFYQGTPVTISAAGVIGVAQAVASASTNTQIAGTFIGAEYNNAIGQRTLTPYFYDSLITTTGDPQVWFWIEGFQGNANDLVYDVQANGPMAASTVGGLFNFVASGTGAVNAGTIIGSGGGAAFSTAAISNTEVASGTVGQVRVLGLSKNIAYPAGSTNAWGDAFTIVQVQIANPSFGYSKGNLS